MHGSSEHLYMDIGTLPRWTTLQTRMLQRRSQRRGEPALKRTWARSSCAGTTSAPGRKGPRISGAPRRMFQGCVCLCLCLCELLYVPAIIYFVLC